MPKLFVGVDLPTSAVDALKRLQPPPAPGLRLTAADQMHLTLHFLGEADAGRAIDALQSVRVTPFTLALSGVGQFPSQGGDVTLWAGLKDAGKLQDLHQALGAALSLKGFPLEARPFNPHITLARIKAGAASGVVQEFLARHAGFLLEEVPVAGFTLYSSSPGAEGPVYRREKEF